MKRKDKNEELQSRRDFFKKAAKAALPILGAVVLSNIPSLGHAKENKTETSETECYCYGCVGGCQDTCYSTCVTTCQYTCVGGCNTTCAGTCVGTCQGTCSGSCAYNSYF